MIAEVVVLLGDRLSTGGRENDASLSDFTPKLGDLDSWWCDLTPNRGAASFYFPSNETGEKI